MKPVVRVVMPLLVAAVLCAGTARAAEPDAAALLKQARSLSEKDDHKQAFDLLNQALRLAPDNLDVNWALGQAAARVGDYEAAIAAYERMLDLKPDLHRVRLEAGECYLKLRAFDMARAEFEKVLAVEPPPMVRLNALVPLAASYIGLGQGATARELLEEAKTLDPSPQASQRIGDLLAAADVSTGEPKRNIIVGRLSVGYGRDSNPAIMPRRHTIDSVFGPVVYSDDDGYKVDFKDPDCFQFYQTFLRHTFRTRWEPLEWRTDFFWFGNMYQTQGDQDVNFFLVSSGPALRLGRHDVEVRGLVNVLEKDWAMYSKGHGFEINTMSSLNKHIHIGTTIKRENKKLYDDRDRDALNYTFALRPLFVWGGKGQHRLFTEFKYEREYNNDGAKHRTPPRSNVALDNGNNRHRDEFVARSISLRYYCDLPWWQLTPYVGYAYRYCEYGARNTFFREVREDESQTVTLGVQKALPWWQMSLDLMHSRTYVDSTNDLYSYDRVLTQLTLNKDF